MQRTQKHIICDLLMRYVFDCNSEFIKKVKLYL